jgi:hypothetical protein
MSAEHLARAAGSPAPPSLSARFGAPWLFLEQFGVAGRRGEGG